VHFAILAVIRGARGRRTVVTGNLGFGDSVLWEFRGKRVKPGKKYQYGGTFSLSIFEFPLYTNILNHNSYLLLCKIMCINSNSNKKCIFETKIRL